MHAKPDCIYLRGTIACRLVHDLPDPGSICGFRDLGFRGLRFRDLGCRIQGYRVWGFGI